MKLSKEQRKKHSQAEAILSKDILTFDEKLFVLDNWLPGANNDIGAIASFFTPSMMAHDFCYEAGRGNVIDLCAGIGMLSFQLHRFTGGDVKLTCVEINSEFVRVGKKILPEATWVCGDVLDEAFIKSLGRFDNVISNPPFGKVRTGVNDSWLKYKGSEFEYKVIEVGSYLAEYDGAFIIPQQSCSFRLSGGMYFKEGDGCKSDKYKKFEKQTGLYLPPPNSGFDLACYKDSWVGTSILCEFAHCEYGEIATAQVEDDEVEAPLPSQPVQGVLF